MAPVASRIDTSVGTESTAVVDCEIHQEEDHDADVPPDHDASGFARDHHSSPYFSFAVGQQLHRRLPVVIFLHQQKEGPPVVLVKQVLVHAIYEGVVDSGAPATKTCRARGVFASERNIVVDSSVHVDAAAQRTCLDGGSIVDDLDLVALTCQPPLGSCRTHLDPCADGCWEL